MSLLLVNRRDLHPVLFIFWTCFIMLITALPFKESPAASQYHLDKFAHAGMFLVLVFLGARTLRLTHFLFMGTVVAVISEIQQYFVPGRTVEIWDLLANLAGTGVGILIFYKRYGSKIHGEKGSI